MTAEPAHPHHDRPYWACQLVGWGGYAVIQFYAAVVLVHLPWQRAGMELLALYGSALLLTHQLRHYMHRHHWRALPASALVPRAMLASVILGAPLGVAYHFMSVGSLSGVQPEDLARAGIEASAIQVSPLVQMLIHLVNWVAAIGAWLVAYFIVGGIRERRQAQLRQSELMRALQLAELRLLKSQLNPHFLFNSLNSVRALIADDPARAQSAVTQLARTLRYTLGSGQDEQVTLAQDLEIVSDYLEIESLRLGERLRIERNIAPDAMAVRIPAMLLQTVVENAIKHGIAELPEGGVLRISARIEAGALRLEVENPRPAQAARAVHEGHEGIGLRNASERLRLLFGARARLDLDLSDPRRALATIHIPRAATP